MAAFQIPDEFISKLYDLTGTRDSHKGFILFCIDNEKNTRTLTTPNADSATMMALRKTAEIWLNEMDARDGVSYGKGEEDEDS